MSFANLWLFEFTRRYDVGLTSGRVPTPKKGLCA